MRPALVALLAVLVAARAAHAEGDVGVVVAGDVTMQPEVASYLERWLRAHGHKLVLSPLSADATNTIFNCLVLDDQKCARAAVEARSRASSVIFARVEVAKGAKHDITFNLSWFVKGHEPIGERRVCEKCTEDSWHGIADAMMSALAGSSQVENGRVSIRSKPSGMIVLLDNVQIGVTPLERDVPVGHHRIELTHAGRSVGAEEVDVTSGTPAEVDITAKADVGGGGGGGGGGGSRVGPAILLGAGITTIGAAGVFLYYGSIGGEHAKYIYPDSTPVGIGLAAVGVGATIGGAILLAQSGHRSAPVASVGPGGGYVGWVTRF